MIRRRYLICSRKPMRIYRYGIGVTHALGDGGPVLLENASWRTINGIWINTPFGHAWLFFRRRPKGLDRTMG